MGKYTSLANTSRGLFTAIERTIRLFHHRWSVPIIATLYRDHGCRFVVLANRLSASRDTLSETLTHLVANGLVTRNPGYGHPLRPEYILTPAGEAVGALCQGLAEAVGREGVVKVALKKWPMPALTVVGRGASHFGEIRLQLPGITSRALALALRDLEAADLVERRLTDPRPAAATYHLTERGARMFPLLDEFAITCASLPVP